MQFSPNAQTAQALSRNKLFAVQAVLTASLARVPSNKLFMFRFGFRASSTCVSGFKAFAYRAQELEYGLGAML